MIEGTAASCEEKKDCQDNLRFARINGIKRFL